MDSLMLVARGTELIVASLVITWALNFKSSFRHQTAAAAAAVTSPPSQLDLLYSVLHPLLMVIGFIVLTSEAIMTHRWLSGLSRGTRKSIHLSLQGVALGFGVMGIWAKFRSERGIIANFYSLHSWLGLLCLALFATQWVMGFLSFWHRVEGKKAREVLLPWHVFIGLYTYGLAVVTAESGLLEKLTFLQNRGRVATRSTEATVVNGLGLGLALLGGVVVFVAVSPKQTSKIKHDAYGNGNWKMYDAGEKFTAENTNGKWKSSI